MINPFGYPHVEKMKARWQSRVRRPASRWLSAIPLPDGRDARGLRRTALYTELARIQVPGIAAHMGAAELLATYEAALISKAEAVMRAEHRKWEGAGDALLRRAAEAIGLQGCS